jgi:cytoplasmic iron level regulating protein YaaA (DUF328/UPF0246 family)
MITVISPAKKLNTNCNFSKDAISQPDFLSKSIELNQILRMKQKTDLMKLMKISDKIAELNYQRNIDFKTDHNIGNSYPAAKIFDGEVYQGLDFDNLNHQEQNYAQSHLRILSGFYGILKPFDLVQPYRLEMGTKLANSKGKNLYDFWQQEVTEKLNQELAKQNQDIIINLASNEYSKVINKKLLNCKFVTINFKDNINDKLKTIMMYAKHARGAMANAIIKNKIDNIELLKQLDINNYRYSKDHSSNDLELVYIRNSN